jgi:hypothetical protein
MGNERTPQLNRWKLSACPSAGEGGVQIGRRGVVTGIRSSGRALSSFRRRSRLLHDGLESTLSARSFQGTDYVQDAVARITRALSEYHRESELFEPGERTLLLMEKLQNEGLVIVPKRRAPRNPERGR